MHGKLVAHTPEFITQLFDEELEKLHCESGASDLGTAETFREAQTYQRSDDREWGIRSDLEDQEPAGRRR